ncbi:MAG: TIGR03808 family TAT-translocated repetitive protein [Alphaproteobacteria bacterium]
MDLKRRLVIASGISFGTAMLPAGSRAETAVQNPKTLSPIVAATTYGVKANTSAFQTEALQAAIDTAASAGLVLYLPPGAYRVEQLRLPSGAQLQGTPGRSIIRGASKQAVISASDTDNVSVTSLTIDGARTGKDDHEGAVTCQNCRNLVIENCQILEAGRMGIALYGCQGRIVHNEVKGAGTTGIFSRDATGLEIASNHVHHCDNNGIQIWRAQKGSDATIVANNRVEHIAAKNGGSGQNGNGINVFRAADVIVTGNRIAHCAYSAVRSNAGSNILITANSCADLGEVAIYAEFDFEGAVIANNLVERAATGIVVTNFNRGGRLAVVEGNLVRDLFVRDDPDRRGVGIFAEADTQISGNVIENAPVLGIGIGWGRHLRDVSVTNNIVREAGVGIGISSSIFAGRALISGNLIAGARQGGIRTLNGDKPIGLELTSNKAAPPSNIELSSNLVR